MELLNPSIGQGNRRTDGEQTFVTKHVTKVCFERWRSSLWTPSKNNLITFARTSSMRFQRSLQGRRRVHGEDGRVRESGDLRMTGFLPSVIQDEQSLLVAGSVDICHDGQALHVPVYSSAHVVSCVIRENDAVDRMRQGDCERPPMTIAGIISSMERRSTCRARQLS